MIDILMFAGLAAAAVFVYLFIVIRYLYFFMAAVLLWAAYDGDGMAQWMVLGILALIAYSLHGAITRRPQ